MDLLLGFPLEKPLSSRSPRRHGSLSLWSQRGHRHGSVLHLLGWERFRIQYRTCRGCVGEYLFGNDDRVAESAHQNATSESIARRVQRVRRDTESRWIATFVRDLFWRRWRRRQLRDDDDRWHRQHLPRGLDRRHRFPSDERATNRFDRSY